MFVCGRFPDFVCIAVGFLAGALEVAAQHASEVEMLMMIQLYAPNLQDVA